MRTIKRHVAVAPVAVARPPSRNQRGQKRYIRSMWYEFSLLGPSRLARPPPASPRARPRPSPKSRFNLSPLLHNTPPEFGVASPRRVGAPRKLLAKATPLFVEAVKMAFSFLRAVRGLRWTAHECEQAREENGSAPTAGGCPFGSYPNECSDNANVLHLEHNRICLAKR